jgi:hypothetical protein
MSLNLINLRKEFIDRIALDYFTVQDFGRFAQVNKRIQSIINEICPIFYQRFEKLHPNVINLDKLGAGPTLGLPEYREPKPESIKSLKDYLNPLREAILLAKHSEDGKAIIITIPAGWSIEKLHAISKAAFCHGIHSAKIDYWDSRIPWGPDSSAKEILQNNPTQETQRVAITNTVLEHSRGRSIEQQQQLLESKGFEKELPDALTVLTVAVVRLILSEGKESSYSRHRLLAVSTRHRLAVSIYISSYTRTNTKTSRGSPLCVRSCTDYVSVSLSLRGDNSHFGVGGLKKLEAPGS